MSAIRPGDIIIDDFAGAAAAKRRPLVVISTDLYHRTRPDLVVAVVTTRVDSAVMPTDYILQDWRASGLHAPSAFRCYFGMLEASGAHVVGHLSDRDWDEVQKRLSLALSCGSPSRK